MRAKPRGLVAAVVAAGGLCGGVFGGLMPAAAADAAQQPQPPHSVVRALGGLRDFRPAAPVAASTAGAQRMTPALAYAMEQLDPVSFAVLRPIPVGGGDPVLRTGDVFVLQFSTNLPGQVRLENKDTAGNVVDLGTYSVLADQLNRIPRDRGIQLQGPPGVERLRFYFFPCIPGEVADRPALQALKGRLPACAGGATRQLAGARAWGTVSPRALVNLAQPDITVALAAAADYQPGELTLIETHIRHQGRSDGH